MPTYEYICKSCEKGFDIFQKMTDEPLKKCPSCGKLKLKKQLGTGAGIIFKGSGFYCTDYRNSSYKDGESKEKSFVSSSPPSSTSPKAGSSTTQANTKKTGKETKI